MVICVLKVESKFKASKLKLIKAEKSQFQGSLSVRVIDIKLSS